MSINKRCQVFTPPEYAEKLIDLIGYRENLVGKKVLENSCGDGNILIMIVKRYLEDCIKKGLTAESIKKSIEKDITAYEIDQDHLQACIIRLDELASTYQLNGVKWNIIKRDFLKEEHSEVYDYVIGNPPYITYRDLSVENRGFLKEEYSTCKIGKFDYCYAFVEASMRVLKDGGKLSYLIPGNIFKNVFGKELRNFILPTINEIYDYTNQKLFIGKLTSSSIMICRKGEESKFLKYYDMSRDIEYKLDKSMLSDKWVFDKKVAEEKNYIRFGDIFNAASTVATLLNKVFIVQDFHEKDGYICTGGHEIEKGLMRIAVSPRSLNRSKTEYLLFPYKYSDKGVVKYGEEEFKEIYPGGYEYLLAYKCGLEKRKSDSSAKWYEFGRSQAIVHSNQEKLLISTLITHRAKVYELDKDVMPTSGIYIVPKGECTLKVAKKIIESQEFLEYVKAIGVISNGNSYRISSKDINEFKFSIDLLQEEEYVKSGI